jgi:uncharacterized membrane protein YebE (DUF533 family)
MKKTILMLATVFALVAGANAQNKLKEDKNLKGEKKRIAQGVRSGEITKGEAKVIEHEVKDVQQAKAAAKADGVVTKSERKEIAKQDRQLDRTIRRTKHNKRDRN